MDGRVDVHCRTAEAEGTLRTCPVRGLWRNSVQDGILGGCWHTVRRAAPADRPSSPRTVCAAELARGFRSTCYQRPFFEDESRADSSRPNSNSMCLYCMSDK
jgi:hypothetical protein